jgi:hypothetical protein
MTGAIPGLEFLPPPLPPPHSRGPWPRYTVRVLWPFFATEVAKVGKGKNRRMQIDTTLQEGGPSLTVSIDRICS